MSDKKSYPEWGAFGEIAEPSKPRLQEPEADVSHCERQMNNPGLLIALPLALLLAACAANVSPNTYSVGSVGQVNRTVAGTIISARLVDIQGTSALGGTTGAAAGGVAGSGIGHGDRANIVGAIGGAIVGGLAGSAIEQASTKQKGMEYIVQTTNNTLMTIVQGAEPAFAVGDKVFVLYGSPARVIADSRH